MIVFQYQDYRALIRDAFAKRAPGGRGQIAKLAQSLGVSASLVGRIIKGSKDLTEEQAIATASFLGISETEADYFLALVQLERAGTTELKKAIRRRLDRDRVQSLRQGSASIHANELKPQDQAIFYSGWDFSAVRLMSDLMGANTTEQLALRLGLSAQRVTDIMDFLIQSGLSTFKNGSIRLGPAKTIVDKNSPYLQRHHMNWRVKALETVPRASGADLFYTAPMTIRKVDAEKLRRQITALTDQAEKYMEDPDPDTFCCLLIDWFNL